MGFVCGFELFVCLFWIWVMSLDCYTGFGFVQSVLLCLLVVLRFGLFALFSDFCLVFGCYFAAVCLGRGLLYVWCFGDWIWVVWVGFALCCFDWFVGGCFEFVGFCLLWWLPLVVLWLVLTCGFGLNYWLFCFVLL